MITPSCDEILELAKEYTTIPVCREIYADMTTPISLLRRLQTRSDRFFLLESVEGGEKWARYSFLGYDPIFRATCKNGTVTLEGEDRAHRQHEDRQRDGELRQGVCGARGHGGADQRPDPASAAQGNRQAALHLQRHRGAVRRYRGKDPRVHL